MSDVYTKVYEVRNTVFPHQTGQFPTRYKRGNKYIMVMVDIDSNAILVDPHKNHTYAELTKSYRAMMLRLKRASIVPQKHILDNEVSTVIKTIIRDEYKMKRSVWLSSQVHTDQSNQGGKLHRVADAQ